MLSVAPRPIIEALNLARESASEPKADEWELIGQVAEVPGAEITCWLRGSATSITCGSRPPKFRESSDGCEDALDLEIERIFRREWMCVGRASTLARAGDRHPIAAPGFAPVLAATLSRGTYSRCSRIQRQAGELTS